MIIFNLIAKKNSDKINNKKIAVLGISYYYQFDFGIPLFIVLSTLFTNNLFIVVFAKERATGQL